MSFETELIAALGTATDAWDIKVSTRRCYFYDFDGYPTRLWGGVGVLQAGGQEWLGTVDAQGVDHHQVPQVQDPRSGASPRYSFTIPYLDKATFDALKADQSLARNRVMTCYRVIVLPGEGLRPGTALQFAYSLTIRGVEFSERFTGEPGSATFIRSATALMRSQEAGRSRVPAGVYSDTAQQERARLLGVASDSFCAFVAGNATRTLTIDG